MSKNSDPVSDIEKTIQLWYEAKAASSDLDKKISKYRTLIEKYMDNKGLSNLTINNMILKRNLQTRENISKSDIPTDIWNKYKKESIFYTYHISHKK